MNGVDYVRESLALIEASLRPGGGSEGGPAAAPLGAARLAARIGYSVQHFSRLFRSLTGESPGDYILRRRLTEAARRVLLEPIPIAGIALEGGWSDYETFSRAFKRQFGVSPSRARNCPGVSARFREPIAPESVIGTQKHGGSTADPAARLSGPRLSDEAAIHLVGLPFFMDRSVRTFHRPWAIASRALADPERIAGRIRPERFCQLSSWLEDEEARGLFILCALEVGPADLQADVVEPPFVHRRLPPCRYLVFTHSGGIAGLREDYERIYGEVLADLEQRPAFSWELQRYTASGDIEISIPVSRS